MTEEESLMELRLRFIEGVVRAKAVDGGVARLGEKLVHCVADLAG